MLIKSKNGWKIKLESGRILPKEYPDKEAGEKRIAQLRSHGEKRHQA